MFQSDIKEFIQVNKLIEEGKEKEAFQVISKLKQRPDFSPKEKLACDLFKANFLRIIGNYLEAIKVAEDIFEEFQKQGDLLSSFDALIIQAYSYAFMVNISKSEIITEQAEELFKMIKEAFSIDLRARESLLVRIKAAIYFFKGEFQHALELNKKAYELAKDTENKALISTSLNNIAHTYHYLQEYDKSIMYAKDAVNINCKITLPSILGTLIEIYVSSGKIDDAKANLDIFRTLIEKVENHRTKNNYLSMKALILKSSLRARDRVEAEDLYKSIALNNTVYSETRIDAIVNLCDLYLTELKITNDPKIIIEIQSHIKNLLSIAEDQHLYLYLAKTYFLQAKLSLLTLDLKKAKHFLIQAQNIAESYGMKQLAMKISYEHDELLKQTKMWENLRISEVPLSERLKLAGLNEQMENMLRRRMIEAPELSDEEPVLLLIVSEGGIPFFSQSFIEDENFEDHLFGGFFTAINSFIHEKFSEGLDRASFGKHTLLMDSFSPFLMCYVYKGQSYLAQKRIKSFIGEIKSNKEVWDKFEEFYHTNRKIQIKDIPSLKPLITKIFIDKNIPLSA